LPHNVAIYLFDDVEVLDFAGPFEVFSTASRVKTRLEPGAPKLFEVFTIGSVAGAIRARGGLMLQPAYTFVNHPHIDILVVPGGIVEAEMEKEQVIDWIGQVAMKAGIIASVCTGAFLLGKAGLLHGRAATTHWEDIPMLRAMFPDVTVQTGKRWIEEGNIITSAGISAGLDMSLHLIGRIEGEELAIRTAKQMEYVWKPAGE
jgi:transcriptional regulator GlxA family with amidase domain